MKWNPRLLLILVPLLLWLAMRSGGIVNPILTSRTPVASEAGSPSVDAEISGTPRPADLSMETAYRPARFSSPEAHALSGGIPTGAFLRDFAPLQGTDTHLVLYILNPSLDYLDGIMDVGMDGESFPMWCGAGDFGQTIYGTYKLALVRDGLIVNEVGVPFPDWDAWPDHPLETPTEEGVVGYTDINDAQGTWNNDGGLMFRHARCVLEDWWKTDKRCIGAGTDFLETRQLQLMDMTGDGLPYEVRFMTEYISCGNRYYVIAGYDQKNDKVSIFNVIDEGGAHPSYSDFAPRADGSVIVDTGCDHGAGYHTYRYFNFDSSRNAYVLYRTSGALACE